MNQSLPGAVSVPADDVNEDKAPTLEPAPRQTEARQRTEEEQDADYDEDREDEDDLDRERRAAAAEPPAPPIRFEDVVSGQFDAEAESPDVPSPKRVLLPQADTPKLHKV